MKKSIMLPQDTWDYLVKHYGLTKYEAYNLDLMDGIEYFMQTIGHPAWYTVPKTAKLVANWMLNDFANSLNSANIPLSQSRVTPRHLAGLVRLIEQGKINNKQAKEVFAEMFHKGRAASQVAAERKFTLLSDPVQLKEICLKIITDNPKPVADYKKGNKAPLNSLKGQIMKLTNGQANMIAATAILEKLLQ